MSVCELNDRAIIGIRSPTIKIAMVTRWWSVGERSPVNSETIALVIGHGRPMRKRDPPRTFVSRIFCPLSRPFFCLFPSSPSCVPFRVTSSLRETKCSFSRSGDLLKEDRPSENVDPYFLVIVFIVFASPLQEQTPISMIDLSKRNNAKLWNMGSRTLQR